MTKKKLYYYNDNPKNVNAYWSSKYLEDFTKTKSLSKIEALINSKVEPRLGIVASAYIYYNKIDKVSKDKHPKIYDLVNLFEKFKDEIYDFNDYSKLNHTIYLMSKNREKNRESKSELLKYINEQLKSNDIPLKNVTDKLNLDYSNTYRALYNNKVSDLSFDKIKNIMKEIKQWKKD